MPVRSKTSRMPSRIASRGTARFSGPKASSASTVAPTIWRAGSWRTVPMACARSRRRSSATRRPSMRTSPARVAGVGVRDEAVDAADKRALAAARGTGHEQDLPGLDGQRDAAYGRLARPAIGEREARRSGAAVRPPGAAGRAHRGADVRRRRATVPGGSAPIVASVMPGSMTMRSPSRTPSRSAAEAWLSARHSRPSESSKRAPRRGDPSEGLGPDQLQVADPRSASPGRSGPSTAARSAGSPPR